MYIFNGILFALIVLFIFAVNFYNYRRESVRHKLLHWFRASRELLLLEQVSGKEKHTLLYDIEALEKIFRAAATDPALTELPEFLTVKSARNSCLDAALQFNISLQKFPGKMVALIIRAKPFAVPEDFSLEK